VPSVLIALYLTIIGAHVVLDWLNIRHRRRFGGSVPSEFAGHIDATTLQKISAYTADREAFGMIRLLGSAAIEIVFLFGGGLAAYDRWVQGLVSSPIAEGVTFFIGVQLASSLLDLPFDVWATFRIEQRHGFNHMSVGLFFADWLKGMLLGTLLLSLVGAGGLWIYYAFPTWYWFWIWFCGLIVAMGLMLASPYVIEPLFIKTTPLENASLSAAVQELAERTGARVKAVLQMDASRRTSHSNAYFTGIGRVKRVVLFDTLLERLTHDEVLAVLGHELGHWKLRHVTQRLIAAALFALLCLCAIARLLAWEGLPASLGLERPSLAAELVMLGFLASVPGFILNPISAYWSRRHEWQADAFAASLTGKPAALASALVKLAQDNLTNLHSHPLYAAFYFSHPPTSQRVKKLTQAAAHAG
jgi:STE24 endopeptidase